MFHVNMEALYFLNFWRPTTTTSTTQKDTQPSALYGDTAKIPMVDMDGEFDQEEDSFFELELTVPDFDNNTNSNTNTNKNSSKDEHPLDRDSNIFDSKEATLHNTNIKAGNREYKYQPPTLSLSPSDFPSKRSKILPIEQPISSKPQSSPISLLKSSAPRFRVLMFRKSKSMATQKAEKKTGGTECFADTKTTTPKHKKHDSSSSSSSKLFTVKFFRLEEAAANVSMFTRQSSLRKHISSPDDDSLSSSSDHESSKRFTNKEVIQKYLKLIKPLYVKVSKKQSDNIRFSGELSVPSPSSSPATLPGSSTKEKKQGNAQGGIRVVCKQLGKSKSTGVSPSAVVSRRDDSLLLQDDGIQSAILHCKRSFNSSRDSSLLSRFASDPLPEKSLSSPRFSTEEDLIN